MIELVSFTKRYGSRTAVDHVSFTCPDRCVTGLIGANGAGKTTILKAVCGLHYGDEGSLMVNGISVSEKPEEIRKTTGFVSENAVFQDNLYVYEYLQECAAIHGAAGCRKLADSKSRRKQLTRMIEQFSLESVLKTRTGALSKGFRQRLCFAQAMMHDPAVLVLDEPVTGLDPLQIIEIRKLVANLGKDRTVLLSTHFMSEVESICDRIVFLKEGKVLAEGTKEEVLKASGTDTLENAFVSFSAITEGGTRE